MLLPSQSCCEAPLKHKRLCKCPGSLLSQATQGASDGESGPQAAQAPSAGAGDPESQTKIWWLQSENCNIFSPFPPSPDLHLTKQADAQKIFAGSQTALVSVSVSPVLCLLQEFLSPITPYLRTQPLLLAFCLEKVCHHKKGVPLWRKRRESKCKKPLRTELLNHSNPAG